MHPFIQLLLIILLAYVIHSMIEYVKATQRAKKPQNHSTTSQRMAEQNWTFDEKQGIVTIQGQIKEVKLRGYNPYSKRFEELEVESITFENAA